MEARLAAQTLPPWVAAAYCELRKKVLDPAFPCTFGTVALGKQQVLFSWSEHQGVEPQRRDIRAILMSYTGQLRGLDAVSASMTPLALFLPPTPTVSEEEYFGRGWALLEWLTLHDPAPWPGNVPADPDDPAWSFCFGGLPLFVNFKTPVHQNRKSRFMRHAFLLLIQAREGFDLLAGDSASGRRARALIRRKLADYDGQPPHPDLAHYGTPLNREWKQYFIPDRDAPLAAECPWGRARRLR